MSLGNLLIFLTLTGWRMDAVPGVEFSQAVESLVGMVSLKIGIGLSGSTLLVETRSKQGNEGRMTNIESPSKFPYSMLLTRILSLCTLIMLVALETISQSLVQNP